MEPEVTVEGIVSAYAAWEAAAMRPSRQASNRREALRALLDARPDLAAGGAAAIAQAALGEEGAAAVTGWRLPYLRQAAGNLRFMEEDRLALARVHSFTYTEFDPGLGALGHGAWRAGGRPAGSTGHVAEELSRFAGHGLASAPGDDRALSLDGSGPGMLLANLPFSAFVTGAASDDPAVVEAMEAAAAAAASSGAEAVLLRIEWTAGMALGQSADGYVRLAERFFPGMEARTALIPNAPFVPMEGVEAFVALAADWRGPFRPVQAWPRRAEAAISEEHAAAAAPVAAAEARAARRLPGRDARRIPPHYGSDARAAVADGPGGPRRLYPKEIAGILGLPAALAVPADVEQAYRLLGESVAAPVAERAVRGLLRALGLD